MNRKVPGSRAEFVGPAEAPGASTSVPPRWETPRLDCLGDLRTRTLGTTVGFGDSGNPARQPKV